MGDKRNIYYVTEEFPRYIGYDRGPAYYPKHEQTPYTPMGSIPQVAHTFAYYEGTYAIMNEKQVAMAESTCSGVFSTLVQCGVDSYASVPVCASLSTFMIL